MKERTDRMGENMTRDRSVKEILQKFENSTNPWREWNLFDEMKTIRGADSAEQDHARYEAIAFYFIPAGRQSPWNTYYGPMATIRLENGEVLHTPDLTKITPEVLQYWRDRLDVAKHPRMRIRYADLLWDLTWSVNKIKPDHNFARIVIDQTLALVDKRLFYSEAQVKLRRALDLAMRIDAVKLAPSVVESIIKFESETAGDDALGFAFDTLINGDVKPELQSSMH